MRIALVALVLGALVSVSRAQAPLGGAPVVVTGGNYGVAPLRLVVDTGGDIHVICSVSGNTLVDQRMSSAGEPRWSAGPAPLGIALASSVCRAVSDGSGGVIVATGNPVTLQRCDRAGNVRWNLPGVNISNSGSGPIKYDLVADGSGGAIVAWSLNAIVRVQHVDSLGNVLWGSSGLTINSSAAVSTAIGACPDANGGIIVIWLDTRSATTQPYAQRVNASGATQWAANGVPVSAPAAVGVAPTVVADGFGGALVLSSTGSGVFVQRINSAGNSLWGTGAAIAGATYTFIETRPVPLCADGAGGAYLAWVANSRVRAQRVTPAGAVAWASGGIAVATGIGDQQSPAGASDGGGGVVLAWTDGRSPLMGDAIWAQRLDSTGSLLWGSGGTAIAEAPGTQQNVVLASGPGALASACWLDFRRYGDESQAVYFQSVTPVGQPGVSDRDAPRLESVRDVGADQGGRVALRWQASALDAPVFTPVPAFGVLMPSLITSYRIWRRIPPTALALRDAGAGGLLRRPAAASSEVSYWEPIATLPAEMLDHYGFVASTTQDSMGSSNPFTAFFVTAVGRDSGLFFHSNVDSAYSVDNLAPIAPAPFTGGYASGAVHLHWRPNAEADFHHYELYRGSSPDFTPTPSNEIAVLADTGYADPIAPGSCYKLVATDVHGNRSPASTLRPQEVGGVVPTEAGALLFVGPVTPNPSSGRMSLVIRASAGQPVGADVYDSQGRRVRRILRTTAAGAPIEISWDGRDESGRSVRSGRYLVDVWAADRHTRRSAVVVR